MTLPDTTRRLHRLLIVGLLATGDVPTAPELATALGVGLDTLREHLRALEHADYLGFDATGRLTCLYPLSAVPTPHAVVIGGERRFAMCSLDALGMAAMLGRRVEIESACPVCATPIRLAVAPGAVECVQPTATVVVARSDGEAPSHEACCGFTVFACGAEHADALVARTSDTSALDLPSALTVGETIFAGMLGDTLPARRTRASSVDGLPSARLA